MSQDRKSRIEKRKPGESYTVLARRYRPQQFADIVGQEPVARALVNALESNRVAHAYLFTGARGVGKTSTARILAKALNCVKGPTPTPCDECGNCQSIATGDDIDVLERHQLQAAVRETHSDENIAAGEPYPYAVETVSAWHDAGQRRRPGVEVGHRHVTRTDGRARIEINQRKYVSSSRSANHERQTQGL